MKEKDLAPRETETLLEEILFELRSGRLEPTGRIADLSLKIAEAAAIEMQRIHQQKIAA